MRVNWSFLVFQACKKIFTPRSKGWMYLEVDNTPYISIIWIITPFKMESLLNFDLLNAYNLNQIISVRRWGNFLRNMETHLWSYMC
jgi:hypothetical protein